MVGDKVGNKISVSRKNWLNDTRKIILSEMRHNPNITKRELAVLIGISETAIDKNIKFLKQNDYIERIGPNKDGWWKVLK